MSSRTAATSRRAFLARLFGVPHAEPPAAPDPAHVVSSVAVVQGRFCLAYQHSFCSTCVERCPVPGAMVMERGLPRVNADLCTGCRLCHDLCPAPRKAILLVERRPAATPTLVPAAAAGFCHP